MVPAIPCCIFGTLAAGLDAPLPDAASGISRGPALSGGGTAAYPVTGRMPPRYDGGVSVLLDPHEKNPGATQVGRRRGRRRPRVHRLSSADEPFLAQPGASAAP